MSRLFRFLLLLAGAGALVAAVRHISRRNREQQQPFFADASRARPCPSRPRPSSRRSWSSRSPSSSPEPVVEPVVVEEPVEPSSPEPVVEAAPSRARRRAASPSSRSPS